MPKPESHKKNDLAELKKHAILFYIGTFTCLLILLFTLFFGIMQDARIAQALAKFTRLFANLL